MTAIVMELNTKACFINNDEVTPVLNNNITQFINLTKILHTGACLIPRKCVWSTDLYIWLFITYSLLCDNGGRQQTDKKKRTSQRIDTTSQEWQLFPTSSMKTLEAKFWIICFGFQTLAARAKCMFSLSYRSK